MTFTLTLLRLVIHTIITARAFPEDKVVAIGGRSISKWFSKRLPSTSSEPAAYGFTSCQHYEDNRLGYIQGVFDLRTIRLTSGRFIQADKQDQTLAELHEASDIVLYR